MSISKQAVDKRGTDEAGTAGDDRAHGSGAFWDAGTDKDASRLDANLVAYDGEILQ
jgi:hypothetical protein